MTVPKVVKHEVIMLHQFLVDVLHTAWTLILVFPFALYVALGQCRDTNQICGIDYD